MVFNPSSTAAQNLQFQQIPFKDVAKVFSSTSKELDLLTNMGKGVKFMDLEQMTLDGRPLRIDVQDSQHTYLAVRGGETPWLPGSDPDTAQMDQIPVPGVQQMLFYGREAYMQVMYRDTVKVAVKTQSGGYKNLYEWLISDAAEGLRNRFSVMLAGTAQGYIGKLKSAGTAGNSYTDCAVEWAGTAGLFSGARWLLQGGFALDAVNSSTGALRTGSQARGRWVDPGGVAVDIGTSGAGVAVTLKAGHGGAWQAGDYLVLKDTRPATVPATQAGYNDLPGLYGLCDVIDDGNVMPYWGSLQRSTYEFTKSQVFGNSGTLRAVSMELFQYCLSQFNQLTAQEISHIYTRPDIMRKLTEFLLQTGTASLAQNTPARWDANVNGNQKIGVKGVDIQPMGMSGVVRQVGSPNCPTHTAFFLNPSQITTVLDSGPVSLDHNGDLRVPGKPVYQRAMRIRGVGPIARWPKGAGFRLDDLIGTHVAQ